MTMTSLIKREPEHKIDDEGTQALARLFLPHGVRGHLNRTYEDECLNHVNTQNYAQRRDASLSTVGSEAAICSGSIIRKPS
jgi:hypothetical protein